MIEQFLSDPAAVQRMRASPIGSQLDSFAARLTQLGYTRASGRDRLWTLSALGRWLRRRRLRIEDLRDDVTAAFLRRRSPARGIRRSDRATLRLFLDHLVATGIIPASPSPALSPICSSNNSTRRIFATTAACHRLLGLAIGSSWAAFCANASAMGRLTCAP